MSLDFGFVWLRKHVHLLSKFKAPACAPTQNPLKPIQTCAMVTAAVAVVDRVDMAVDMDAIHTLALVALHLVRILNP